MRCFSKIDLKQHAAKLKQADSMHTLLYKHHLPGQQISNDIMFPLKRSKKVFKQPPRSYGANMHCELRREFWRQQIHHLLEASAFEDKEFYAMNCTYLAKNSKSLNRLVAICNLGWLDWSSCSWLVTIIALKRVVAAFDFSPWIA